MRKVRIGNDINVRWEVKTDGQAVSLEGKALKLYVRSAYRKEEITTFTVEGCVVSFTYPASMQRMTGARAVILEDVTEGAPRRTVCADQAFTLVAHSCEENDDDVEFEDFMVSLQSNVLIGKPGLSAYEVWLSEGYTGTLEDWYAFLRKPATDIAADVAEAEAERKAAETARQEAEDQRIASDQERTTAETERTTSEQARQENETTRVSAETERVLAELSRQRAEAKREQAAKDNKAATDAAVADAQAATEAADTATGKANTAATNADMATANANAAADAASKVNAVLGDDNVLKVTDRTGAEKSLELVAQAAATEMAKKVEQSAADIAELSSKISEERTRVDSELEKKFAKADIVQEPGNSEELVMSQKAVSDKLKGFSQKEVDEEGLYLCNEKGEVILRLDILDTKNPIGDNMISYITKHVKKEIISPCIEEGFYICNENREVIAQYKDNEWQFIGIEKEVKINPCYSSLGLESGVIKADTLSNGELVLMDYPQYLKRNATVSFGAKISTFSQVKVGVKGTYFCLAQIDSTNISIIHNTGTIKTEAHGLNISGWIDVVLKVEELNVEISIHSLDGYKKITATLPFRELYGRPTLEVDENTNLTDISLRGYCDDFQKSIWFVGDSYTSCTEVRWTGQMLNFGIDNWMLLGLAGGKSKDLYEDLLLALKYGTPTYLVWCMGMNDADNGSLNTDYKKYFELVKAKCDELGIIMVPATVPCVKTSAHPTYARDNSYKNAFIKASGLRYIDLAKAVGGDTFTDDAWYEGYLETKSPWIHTSELGAKAQMAQIIRDFPEILRNK